MHLKEFSFSRIRFRFHEWRRVERSVLARRNDSRARNLSSLFLFLSHSLSPLTSSFFSHPFATFPLYAESTNAYFQPYPYLPNGRFTSHGNQRDILSFHMHGSRKSISSIAIVRGTIVYNLELKLSIYCIAVKKLCSNIISYSKRSSNIIFKGEYFITRCKNPRLFLSFSVKSIFIYIIL